jgi:hypothetical protein
MAIRNRVVKFLGLAMLAALVATAAAAQHPTLGPNSPAPDPRSKAENSLQTSASRAVEFGYRQGVESCTFRARGLRRTIRSYLVDEWALGIERYDGKANLFFEVRIIDVAGRVLAIERPTLYLFGSGPTYDWQPGRSSAEGYVRIEKVIEATGPRERLGFTTAVEERGIRELAITLPNGRGDAYIVLEDGATRRQFEFFADCACKLFGHEPQDLFACP